MRFFSLKACPVDQIHFFWPCNIHAGLFRAPTQPNSAWQRKQGYAHYLLTVANGVLTNRRMCFLSLPLFWLRKPVERTAKVSAVEPPPPPTPQHNAEIEWLCHSIRDNEGWLVFPDLIQRHGAHGDGYKSRSLVLMAHFSQAALRNRPWVKCPLSWRKAVFSQGHLNPFLNHFYIISLDLGAKWLAVWWTGTSKGCFSPSPLVPAPAPHDPG